MSGPQQLLCRRCRAAVPMGRRNYCSHTCMRRAVHAGWRARNLEAERARASRWSSENRDWKNAWSRRRYKETRDTWLVKLRQYQRANPDKVREWRRAWQERNQEKVAHYKREWKIRNPEADARYYYSRNYAGIPDWLIDALVLRRVVQKKLRRTTCPVPPGQVSGTAEEP